MSQETIPRSVELFRSGQLDEALAEAAGQVKIAPTAIEHRWRLAELLCFKGEWQRADGHLDAIASQKQSMATSVALFRQILRAEAARQQFYADGRVPLFLHDPSEEMQLRLRASIELRQGRHEEAVAMLADAEKLRVPPKGKLNDRPIADLRDLDDLTASLLEVLTSTGKYYWIPLQSVRLMERKEVESLRDLLYVPMRLVVKDGPDGVVYLPALYHGSHACPDQGYGLGQGSDWSGSPVRGIGQRVFLAGDEAVAISDVATLELD